MDKEFTHGQMVQNTLENGKMLNFMDSELTHFPMEEF